MRNKKNKKEINCKRLCLSQLILLMIFVTSCKKFIEVAPPVTSSNASTVYNDRTKVAAVLTGIYTNLSKGTISGGGFTSISLFTGLSADELMLFDLNNLTMLNYYRNQLTDLNPSSFDFWYSIYPYVYSANDVIDGITKSTSLPLALRQQLLGEAKFIRAFCYFYLVNLYGDVPLALGTDYKINASLSRTPKDLVWTQIIEDLRDAQTLLSDKYLNADAVTPYANGSEQRVRPTKWAASAMLARASLYNGDYANAEAYASTVISNISLFDTVSLNKSSSNVFAKESKEAIWQLQPVGTGINSNTAEGRIFILPSTGPSSRFPVHLNSKIVNDFEIGDQRRVSWVGSVIPVTGGTTYYYPYKYKIGNLNTNTQEYSIVLRLAEQYLIRAEARAYQNNISGALADLNIIRKRARLGESNVNDKASLLAAIMNERKFELFLEWGHRWFDLKRTNSINEIMPQVCIQKGGSWDANSALYPVMLSELQKNPNISQTEGY